MKTLFTVVVGTELQRKYSLSYEQKFWWKHFRCSSWIFCYAIYYAVLTFEAMEETVVCEHSNESYWAIFSCGVVYYALQVVLTFEALDETVVCNHLKYAFEHYFQVVLFIMLYKVF